MGWRMEAESWDVGNSLIELIIGGVMLYYNLVAFIKFIDERTMTLVNNVTLTKTLLNNPYQLLSLGLRGLVTLCLPHFSICFTSETWRTKQSNNS